MCYLWTIVLLFFLCVFVVVLLIDIEMNHCTMDYDMMFDLPYFEVTKENSQKIIFDKAINDMKTLDDHILNTIQSKFQNIFVCVCFLL